MSRSIRTIRAERLAFMLEDCGAKVLITEESLRASLPPLPAVSEVIYLDRDAEALAAERQDAPRSEVDLSNLAYAIYTSGSTGQPKAALLTHRGLFNLAASEIRLYGIGPQSRVLQFASLSFDASLSEIAMALCSGAALYVEERDIILPGADLEGYLDREKITVLSLTPSALAVARSRRRPQRGASHRGRRALLGRAGRALGGPMPLLQHLWSDRGHCRHHLRRIPRRGAAAHYRPAAAQRPGLPPRPGARAGSRGCGRRALHRRHRGGARLPQPAGT